MVTFLDVSLLEPFKIIFPVLLVFAIVFAILQKTEAVSKTVSINAIIAVAASLMILVSKTLIDIINFMVPWFVVVIIFFILLLLIFQIFGAKEKDIFAYMQKDKGVSWVIIGIALIIFIAAGAKVLGQTVLEAGTAPGEELAEGEVGVATGSFETNIITTLRNPKILGLGIMFVILIFAVGLLTGSAAKG